MNRPKDDKSEYWDKAKYIYDETLKGRTLLSLSNELEIDKGSASKLRKSYKLYVLDYEMNVSTLRRVSAFDLYQAQMSKVKLVTDRTSAEFLLSELLNGKDFNALRKQANVASKSRAEHVIEDIKGRLTLLKVAKVNLPKRIEIERIVEKYHASINRCRDNPVKAERLLVDCFVEVASIYVDS